MRLDSDGDVVFVGFSPYGLRQLAGACGGAVSIVNVHVDMSGVVRGLDELRQVALKGNRLLVDLADVLRNPSAVAGDELYRRAVLAFGQGWLEEARGDAEASIARFPYRPSAQLLLGTACALLDDPLSADRAFGAAVRYGSASEVAFACEAAILGARLRALAGAVPAALELLESAKQTLPFSLWVHAESAAIRGDLPWPPRGEPIEMFSALRSIGDEGIAELDRRLASEYASFASHVARASGKELKLVAGEATLKDVQELLSGLPPAQGLSGAASLLAAALRDGEIPKGSATIEIKFNGSPPTVLRQTVAAPAAKFFGVVPVGAR